MPEPERPQYMPYADLTYPDGIVFGVVPTSGIEAPLELRAVKTDRAGKDLGYEQACDAALEKINTVLAALNEPLAA